MALTNASRLADFGTGIGTQGAILQVDNADQMVGIGTTDPTSKLEVKGDFKVSAASTLSGAVKISDSTNSTSTTTGALIVTGGVGIGASLHVDGDVSIGGTLTYEDVTNIDSVGLLTARSGLRVTAGGVVVTAGVSTFASRMNVNSSALFNEGLRVTAGVTTISGTSTFAGRLNVNSTLQVTEGLNVTAGLVTFTNSGTSTYGVDIVNASSGSSGLRIRAGDADAQYSLLVEDKDGTNLFEVLAGGGGANLRSGSLYVLDKIIHYGDTNTAIRFPAADTISLETAAVERVRVDSNGKVGIGTAPAEDVHILAATPTLLVEGTNTGTGAIVADVDVRAQYYRKAGYSISDSNANEDIFIGRPYGSGDTTAPLVFDFQGTERVRIRQDGRVGFGTNNPAEELHIFGEAAVVALVESVGANDSRVRIKAPSDRISYLEFADGDDVDVGEVRYDHSSNHMAFIVNAGERARIDSNGMIGIGGVTPKTQNTFAAIEIGAGGFIGGQTSAKTTEIVTNAYYNSGWKYKHGSLAATQYYQYAGYHAFTTAAAGSADAAISFTERLRINSDGQAIFKGETTAAQGSVGIEAQDPAIRLYDTNGTANVRKWEMRNVGAGSYLQLRMINDANDTFTDRLQITSTGRFQFYSSAGSFTSFRESFKSGAVSNGGTFTAQTHNCHACGTVTITSNLDGSSNNKKCIQFPISLNSTSNANLGSAIFEIDGSSGQSFSVAGTSKGVIVTNSSGNTVLITVTFDITGSV